MAEKPSPEYDTAREALSQEHESAAEKKREAKPHRVVGMHIRHHVHEGKSKGFVAKHTHHLQHSGEPLTLEQEAELRAQHAHTDGQPEHILPDMDALHDHLEEHMGEPNDGEAEAEARPGV